MSGNDSDTDKRATMSRPPSASAAGKRWSQFFRFLVGWILAAVVGSAILIYLIVPGPAPADEAEIPDAPAPSVASDVIEPRPAALADSVDIFADAEPPAGEPAAPDVSPPEPARARNRPERRRSASDTDHANAVAAHVREASALVKSGDYAEARKIYQAALELDPDNDQVKLLLDQVDKLSDLEARNQSPGRGFRASPTELTGGGGSGATLPADLILEIKPDAPLPGDPYHLRLRLHNLSERETTVTAVELVEGPQSLARERGKPFTRSLSIPAGDTVLLWERRGGWTESDRSGTLQMVVTLSDGSRLSKRMSW